MGYNFRMRKLKVFFVVTKGDKGGAQKYVGDLSEMLDREKFEVEIFSGRDGEDANPSEIERKFHGAGESKKLKWLSNDFEPHFLFYKDWLALAELYKIFKREKPDVAHLNSSKAGVVGSVAAKLASVPKIVFTAHGWVFTDETLPRWKKSLYAIFHKISSFFQDKIVNVSGFDKNAAISFGAISSERLAVVYNGIDFKKAGEGFLKIKEARKKIRERLGGEKSFKEKEIWVGSLGRLVSEKNFKLLIEAAGKIKETSRLSVGSLRQARNVKKNIKFFVIGEGYEKEKLKLKIKSLKLENDFFVVPPEGEDWKLMQAFDLFVLPSVKEGMPYTLIEAMAAKIPVLTSGVGGMREIMEDEKGYFFRNGDAEDLAEKIIYILNNKKEAKGRVEKAFIFAKDNLNLKRMVMETENVYLGGVSF